MKNIYFIRLFVTNIIVISLLVAGTLQFATTELQLTLLSTISLCTAVIVIAVMLALSATIFAIKKPLAELNNCTDSVTKSVSHLVEASNSLSAASVEQAASIEQTVATITELNATVMSNADNAKKSSVVSENSQRAVADGQHAVGEMIQAISHISVSHNTIMQEVHNGNRRITEIVKMIMEISQKTKTINDIVFQTKLLSFNASVEAARAGEHGKGFAVVAEEIGNLAHVSGNASKAITEMVDSSIHKVNSIVKETTGKIQTFVDNGNSKVTAGLDVAKKCGQVLQQVVDNVAQLNLMIAEIAFSSKEQSKGMNEIASTMVQLDTVTRQNSLAAQETARSSNEIFRQSNILRKTLQKLQGDDFHLRSTEMKAKSKLGVIPIENRKQKLKVAATESSTLKRASGGEIPSSENPDFEDV